MARRTRRALGTAAVLAVALVACSEITFEGGGPATLTLTSDRASVGAGDQVTFSYDARGSILIGVIVAYGDGQADSVDLAGAQSASGRVFHAYQSAGSYTVVGTLLDNLQGSTTAELTVTVSAGR